MLIVLISIISYQGIYLDYQWDSPSIITFDTAHLDNFSQYNTNNLFFEFDTAAEVNSSLYLATTSWFLTSHYPSSQGFYIVKAKNPTFWTPVLNISSLYKTTTGYCCPNIMTNILTMSNNSQIFITGNSTLGQLYSSRSSDGGNTWSTGQPLPLNISSFHTIDKSAIFSYNNTEW